MPVVQDTFNTNYDIGYPGMIANGETQNRISRTITDAAGIAFGSAAFQGVGIHTCQKSSAAGAAKFLGIVIVDHGLPIMPGQTADVYPQYSNVPLFQRGSIWVKVGATAVTQSGQVAVLDADGTFVPAGAGATNLPGWQYDWATTPGNMVQISNNRAIAV